MMFGVNHLGHFLLTQLLLPLLQKNTPSRVVIVASRAHTRVTAVDFDGLQKPTVTTTGFMEYSVSKLCNLVHAQELARRTQGTGLTVYALHPGVVASDIWRKVPWPIRPVMNLFMEDNVSGARTSIWCATEPSLARESGRYYDKCRAVETAPLAKDPELARTLWEKSEAWTAAFTQRASA